MSVNTIMEQEFVELLNSLDTIKSKLETPYDYLCHILKNKYENPKLTDNDWDIIYKEKEELEIINKLLDETIETVNRLKHEIFK